MKTPLTKLVLNIIGDISGSTIELARLINAISTRYVSAYSRGGYGYVMELKRLQRAAEVKRILINLKRSKYIKAEKIGKRFVLSLTPKGEAAIFSARLRNAKSQTSRNYTVIIFDVPVSHSSLRRQFRQLIREGGFEMLQRSVWLSRADVYEQVANYIRQVRLQSWVNVFRATDVLHLPQNKV